MKIWKLTIKLEEPFCCSRKPLEGNETPTTPFIPATTLRGAVASALLRKGEGDRIPAWFGVGGPHWSPGWPAGNEGEDGPVIPMPQCWAEEKSGTIKGVRNLFDAPMVDKDGRSLVWRQISQPFCVVDGKGQLTRLISGRGDTQMHVALDYERQASRRTALYSRSELPDNQVFLAWVEDPEDRIDATLLEGPLEMGKRRTAGNGAANVAVAEEEDGTPWAVSTLADKEKVRIQLMSDAIVPGPWGGNWTGFSREMLNRAMWPDSPAGGVDGVCGYSGTVQVAGWSNVWDLPREQALAIRAGSVCQIEFAVRISPERKAEGLRRLSQGLGVRREEGFGIVALCPNWLYTQREYAIEEPVAKFLKAAQTWPGFKESKYSQVRTLAGQAGELARRIHGSEDLARKIRDLATYSLRTDKPEQVADYLKKMGGRPHSRGWDDAKEEFSATVAGARDIEELRFLLGAAATLAGRGER